MSTTVYALLIMALLNGKASVNPAQDTTLAQLPKGSAGKVSLALRMDRRLDGGAGARLAEPRPEGFGLVGEYHDGRFLRVDRGAGRDTRIGVGIKRTF